MPIPKPHPPNETIAQHFAGRAASVRATYDRLVETSRAFGPVREEPKKTSIHLARRSAFAGVATRKESLLLTIRAAKDIRSPRVVRREQVSAHRWHLEVRLDDPRQVDRELKGWLRKAFDLAG